MPEGEKTSIKVRGNYSRLFIQVTIAETTDIYIGDY